MSSASSVNPASSVRPVPPVTGAGSTRVVVVRHGHAVYADPDRLDDDRGGRLSACGRQQLRAVAERFAAEPAVAVWSSGRGRAVRSAQLLAAPHGLVVRIDARLREFDLGAWAGASLADVWEPVASVQDAWAAGDLAAHCPGAEDGRAVAARVAAVLGDVVACHPGGTVLVVCHGGAMTVGLPALTGFDAGRVAALGVPNGGVVELVHQGGGWRCLSWAGEPTG